MKLSERQKNKLIKTILWIIKDSKNSFWDGYSLKEVLRFHFELIEVILKGVK